MKLESGYLPPYSCREITICTVAGRGERQKPSSYCYASMDILSETNFMITTTEHLF